VRYHSRVRVVPLVVSACALAGCDSIWDLEHVEELECPDAVGHDEDGDTIDDVCDACPFADVHGADDDDDGIALPCDPDPTTPNQVVLFSGFDEITRTRFLATDGGFKPDAYHVTGTGSAQLIAKLDPASVWVSVGVDVHRREGTGYSEIGLVFDAIATTDDTQLNGYLCVLGFGNNETYVETYQRRRPDSDDPGNHSSTPVDIATFTGTIRAAYDRTAMPAASCSFVATDGSEAAISGTPDMAQAPGDLALFAQDVDADFRYLFVVTK
jgi:hypothetical protein